MRVRKAARVAIIEPDGYVLLMHYHHIHGALAGRDYWSLPGGGLEDGESPEVAARRELFEETGLSEVGNLIVADTFSFEFMLGDGETVQAQETLFVLYVDRRHHDNSGLVGTEKAIVDEYRWWSSSEIARSNETVYPIGLAEIVNKFIR